ncbi:hypothetical protein V8E52_006521 [Russula decolorans]
MLPKVLLIFLRLWTCAALSRLMREKALREKEDGMRKGLKSGVLHLTLGWSAGGCKKTSESSEVLLRGLAEAIEGREWVAISRSHRVRGYTVQSLSYKGGKAHNLA